MRVRRHMRSASAAAPGISVEAFGRMVAGSNSVMIASRDQGLTSAYADLTVSPEFTGRGLNTGTAYPFRLYTDTCGQLAVRANTTGSNSINEIADGWVFQP